MWWYGDAGLSAKRSLRRCHRGRVCFDFFDGDGFHDGLAGVAIRDLLCFLDQFFES